MDDATPLSMPSPFKSWHTDTYPAIDPCRPALSLKGKSAVVSGGGGAIGSATVCALAKAGASLIGIIGRTQKTLNETKAKIESQYPNTKVTAVTADVTSLSSLEAAFKQIRAHASSPLDILVNNAGHIAQPATLTKSDPKEWWTSFEINVLGAFNSIRAFLPLASPTAAIINIATAATHFPPFGVKNLSAYSASKLAALKVFEFVATENPNLHVVSMQPGVIASDMNTKHAELPPMDTPELAGSFVVWACSEEARFVRGKLVWANWDVDEMKAMAEEIQGSPLFTMVLAGWPSMS